LLFFPANTKASAGIWLFRMISFCNEIVGTYGSGILIQHGLYVKLAVCKRIGAHCIYSGDKMPSSHYGATGRRNPNYSLSQKKMRAPLFCHNSATTWDFEPNQDVTLSREPAPTFCICWSHHSILMCHQKRPNIETCTF
jgi:hypothetical protein